MSDVNGRAADAASDAQLLWIENEVLYTLDERRRVIGSWGVGIGITADDQILVPGADTPDDLVAAIGAVLAATPSPPDPPAAPPALARCQQLLEEGGAAIEVRSGPRYVIPLQATFSSGGRVMRSDRDDPEWLADKNPGNWEVGEWMELLGGSLGPWAMTIVDERIASICHTPRKLTDRGAECGIWTHESFRRQGHAATAVAAWADTLRPTGRHLFYSTDAGNYSSQHVAERLGLRRIAWFWSLTAKP